MKCFSFSSLVLLLAVNLLWSCNKSDADDGGGGPGKAGGVYVGYSTGSQYNNRDALLWHDGASTTLNDDYTGV